MSSEQLVGKPKTKSYSHRDEMFNALTIEFEMVPIGVLQDIFAFCEKQAATKREFRAFTDHEVANAALLSGFSLSTAHGQGANKLMPISDHHTLKEFAERINNRIESNKQ